MTRRLPTLVAVAASTLIIVAGCGGTSSAPELTDPTAIVTAALKSTEAAKSVHVDADGRRHGPDRDPRPRRDRRPDRPLTGTTAAADVDLAKTAAHATFSVPALLNLAGELIAVDGKALPQDHDRPARSTTAIDLATLPIDRPTRERPARPARRLPARAADVAARSRATTSPAAASSATR